MERLKVGDEVRIQCRKCLSFYDYMFPVQSYSDCAKVVIDSTTNGIVCKIWNDRVCAYINSKTNETINYPKISVKCGDYTVTLYEPNFEKINKL